MLTPIPSTQMNSIANVINAQVLIQKIQSLPPERIVEVDDFVEFLTLRMAQAQAFTQDRALTRMATQASESSFAQVWDNAEDEAYDAL
jgi:Protein of unknown function (DUF2281)